MGGFVPSSPWRWWMEGRSVRPAFAICGRRSMHTLVHCRQGRDRTGSVLAAYLVRHRGLASDEAVCRVREASPQAMISVGFDRLPWLFADLDVPVR